MSYKNKQYRSSLTLTSTWNLTVFGYSVGTGRSEMVLGYGKGPTFYQHFTNILPTFYQHFTNIFAPPVKKCYSRSRFANVNISSRPNEKMDFRFGFSIESYAKIQNFRSIRDMKMFLWQCPFSVKNISVSHININLGKTFFSQILIFMENTNVFSGRS